MPMLTMRKIIIIMIACGLMAILPFVFGGEKNDVSVKNVTTQRVMEETAVIVSKENPFYSLIATPATLFYDTHMHVKPLLVQDFSSPSKPIKQFKELYGMGDAIFIDEPAERRRRRGSKRFSRPNPVHFFDGATICSDRVVASPSSS